MAERNFLKQGCGIQMVTTAIAVVVVFATLFLGLRAYEERVAVQAVRLTVEHRIADVDYARAGQAKDIDALWAVYGPQDDLSEAEFFAMADPVVSRHHSLLPLFIAALGGGLVCALLGVGFSLSRRTKAYQRLIAEKARELAESQQQLAQMTIRDAQTGLYNRRHFDELLDAECRRAVREFNPLTLMRVALDGARVEAASTEEQQSESQSVTRIANLLKTSIARPGDVAARFDARSFVLLLPATNEQSPQLAQRLCEQARALCQDTPLTVSIGISTLQPSAQLTAEHILAVTDTALKCAQQQGGNQVCSNAEKPRDLPVTYSS